MIKLFLTDLDGTLTDGTYGISSQSDDMSKRFHTRDFHGMRLLHESGVEIAVITCSRSHVTRKQFGNAASYARLFIGVEDKRRAIYNAYVYPQKQKYKWDEIAFIGDDLPDIELLKEVGAAACPADADAAIRNLIYEMSDGIILIRNGGCGCVREFINIILEANTHEREEAEYKATRV